MTDTWWHHAACRGSDPEVFHPVRGDTDGTKAALAICAACPVKDDCLTYAMKHREMQGVWGGLSANQRKKLASSWVRVMQCQRCGTDVSCVSGRPRKYCESCRGNARTKTQSDYARTNQYQSNRCPVCRSEFFGKHVCCTALCLRVYRKQQVAS